MLKFRRNKLKPWMVLFKGGKFNKRVVIKIQNISWQAGIVALGEGAGYITLSKARMKLGLVFGETIEFELTEDDSEYGIEMAEEFEEILNQDQDANRIFELKKKCPATCYAMLFK